MPLKGAYTVDELAQRCARDEIEIERLRAALKEIADVKPVSGAKTDYEVYASMAGQCKQIAYKTLNEQ